MNFIWSSQSTRCSRRTPLELGQLVAVDDQQLVLVELHFLRDVRIEHGQAGAAVVDQQVLVLPEDALQHRHVDVLAVEVGVAAFSSRLWLVSSTTSDRSPADRAGP